MTPSQSTDDLVKRLKKECNFHVYGQCSTLACLKRDAGGVRAAFPLELIGCDAKQEIDTIERLLREKQEQAKTIETMQDVLCRIYFQPGAGESMSDAAGNCVDAMKRLAEPYAADAIDAARSEVKP